MKYLIVPIEIAEKLTQGKFKDINGADHEICPIVGEMNGQQVYFLQSDLKVNKIFESVFADFEVCEIKDIESVKPVSYDSKGIVTTDPSKIVTVKTILTEKK